MKAHTASVATKRNRFVGADVPEDLFEEFKALADSHDRSFSAELRQAMRAHLEAHRGEGSAEAA